MAGGTLLWPKPTGKTDGRPSLRAAALSLSEAERKRVVAEACRPPKDAGVPVTHWSRSLLGEHIRSQGYAVSDSTVGRILRSELLQPHRQKMWITSHDEEFREKRDDVLRTYYETPADEHIICVDEKTGIQALERRYADIPMQPGQAVRREFEYIRHGTLCLMGAFDVRTGKLFGFTDNSRGSDNFIDLLDLVDTCYTEGRGHIVMDNLFDHDTDEVNEWFDDHPRWTRHFTPKHASWLNQIEDAFSFLGRRVIARGSFASKEDLRNRIYSYLIWHNQDARPFHWTYRPKSWSGKGDSTSDPGH